MPITRNKITEFLFNHKDQIDELYQVMSSEQVKANFDSRAEQLAESLAGLIEDLLAVTNGDSGAHNVGIQPIEGLPGRNIYEVLLSVKSALSSVVLGSLPDNTITNEKLISDIRIGSLARLTTTAKDSITSAINELKTITDSLDDIVDQKLTGLKVSDTAEAGSLLRLNTFGKFEASITGDANTVDGKHANLALTTNEKADLAGAINEINDNKIEKSMLSSYKTPNKILLTDANGDLRTDITGNARLLGWKKAEDFAPAGFGLGTTAKDISAQDLNNIFNTGFYMAWGSPNQPPGLVGNNWAYYIITKHNDRWQSQIAIEFVTGNVWTRSRVDNTWNSWQRLSQNNEMIGQVSYFAMATAPTGWLICNGSNVSRTSYKDLFTAIGTTFGAGDGSTTFTLPDLRGEFIRGLDNGRGIDNGRALGSRQDHAFASHNHSGSTDTQGWHEHRGLRYAEGIPVALSSYNGSQSGYSTGYSSINVDPSILYVQGAGSHAHNFTTSSNGSNETRPRNVALLPCIKF